MSLETRIKWRPYPEQTPTIARGWTFRECPVLLGEEGEKPSITSLLYFKNHGWAQSGEEVGFIPVGYPVTHFALPEDITTEETA